MLKKVILIFLFLSLISFAENEDFSISEPIQIGIKYNEATARIEAFKDVELKLKKDLFKDYLTDKNRKENLKAIENKQLIINDDRQLCPFYLKDVLASYSITYFDKPEINLYYNYLGQLLKFEILSGQDYPKKYLGYTRYGNLLSVAFEVDKDEQFIYDKDGKLVAHWVKNKITNETKTDKILNKFNFQRGLLEK